MNKLSWLFFFPLLSSCVTLQPTTGCAVSGLLSAGCDCANSITHEETHLTFEECLSFLEADPKTGRGAAIFHSSADFNTINTELKEMCRMLGPRCSIATQALIDSNERMVRRAQSYSTLHPQ